MYVLTYVLGSVEVLVVLIEVASRIRMLVELEGRFWVGGLLIYESLE